MSHAGMLHIFHGSMYTRVTDSQVMGHEMSRTVAAIREGVSNVAVGNPVITIMPLDTTL